MGDAAIRPGGDRGDRGGLAPICRAELAEDGADVAAGRARAEEEALRDLGIGETLAQEHEHFLLSEGQGVVGLILRGGRCLIAARFKECRSRSRVGCASRLP